MLSQLRSIPEWKSLCINPDLKPAGEERRKLTQELATRRSLGGESLNIKKGKITKVTKHAMQSIFPDVQWDRYENSRHEKALQKGQEGVAKKKLKNYNNMRRSPV